MGKVRVMTQFNFIRKRNTIQHIWMLKPLIIYITNAARHLVEPWLLFYSMSWFVAFMAQYETKDAQDVSVDTAMVKMIALVLLYAFVFLYDVVSQECR